MANATRIRIPSRWQNSHHEAKPNIRVADFQLGLGSCGKVVTALYCEVGRDWVKVTQITECGEIKEFHYHASDITGRVEITR